MTGESLVPPETPMSAFCTRHHGLQRGNIRLRWRRIPHIDLHGLGAKKVQPGSAKGRAWPLMQEQRKRWMGRRRERWCF